MRQSPALVFLLFFALAPLHGTGGSAACHAEQDPGSPPLIDQLPRTPPKEPDDALKTFQTRDGFRMELLAWEPMVTDPVAMAYDADGRAYVVEMNDYPHVDRDADVPFTDQSAQPPIGRVRLLEDLDGDGRFDRGVIFAERLSWPAGVAAWKDGVFVGATPDIWYLRDTDGDGRADVRRKVFTGFRKFNVQAVMNNLKWALDHKIYGSAAGNGGMVLSARQPGGEPIRISRRDFRFDPLSEALDVISGGARFGNTFDDWGNRFVCNIRNPAQHVVLPDRYLLRNPALPVSRALHDCARSGDQVPVYPTSEPEPWRTLRARRWVARTDRKYPRSETTAAGSVTSSSGITIYRGSAYPDAMRGNFFLGEVAGNLIHRESLTPSGVTFKAKRVEQKTEFVTSTDNWFRPVNFVNAPDGTLHVLDMYRETIEHPWSIPDDIRAALDLRSGADRGRIYRLAGPGFEPPAPPRLTGADTEQLVALLAHRNAWHRETAHRLLFERQDSAAVSPLRNLLRESPVPLARLHALWSLHGLAALRDEDLMHGLKDSTPGVREHAVRLAEPRLASAQPLRERVIAMASDAEPRVRFQIAFTLGEIDDPRALDALAAIARKDAADPWIRTAVLSSVRHTAGRLLVMLASEGSAGQGEANREILHPLALVCGASNRSEPIIGVLNAIAATDPAVTRTVVSGLGEGLRRAGGSFKTLLRDDAPSGVAGLLARAQKDAAVDAQAPEAVLHDRLEAVRLLGHFDLTAVKATLTDLLDAAHPQKLQLAAVQTLAAFTEPAVATVLLERWRSYTPQVRQEVIEALVARPTRVSALLDAVEAGRVMPGHLPATRRQLLIKHRDPKIRKRAAALFGGGPFGSRKDVVARYQPALSLPGDTSRGQAVFERTCMTCHRHHGKGHDIGPPLSTIQGRSPDNIMLHILDPNREVAPSYIEYVVYLKNARIATGVIAAETATSITLRRPENVEETILRRNIEQIGSLGKSIMPEGLEENITLQEMADLLAFLLSPSADE